MKRKEIKFKFNIDDKDKNDYDSKKIRKQSISHLKMLSLEVELYYIPLHLHTAKESKSLQLAYNL